MEADGEEVGLLDADRVLDEDMDIELVGVAERDEEGDALTVELTLFEEDRVLLLLADNEGVGEGVVLRVREEVGEDGGLRESEAELERLGVGDREVDRVWVGVPDGLSERVLEREFEVDALPLLVRLADALAVRE